MRWQHLSSMLPLHYQERNGEWGIFISRLTITIKFPFHSFELWDFLLKMEEINKINGAKMSHDTRLWVIKVSFFIKVVLKLCTMFCLLFLLTFKWWTILCYTLFENMWITICVQIQSVVVVGFKADCLTGDLGPWVECPPWGSF